MRAEAVRLMQSREKRNHYTNGADRKYFWGKPEGVNPGYSDCSAAVRAAILRASGGTVDIGYNTDAQIKNRAKGVVLEMAAKGQTYPSADRLKPGVCIYFRGNTSHMLDVGHVEMIIDSTHCIGHGSGTGPVVHDLKDYCKARGNGSKGYLCLVDWLPDTETYKLGDRLLQAGMEAPDVAELQTALKALGADLGTYGANHDGVDGEYGNLTKAAVKAFEAAHGLISDGIADIACIKAIQAAVAALANPGAPSAPTEGPGDDEDDTALYPVTGIVPDVSSNQGPIKDFDAFCRGTDFTIFRVIRSDGSIDSEAVRNMTECDKRDYPYFGYIFFKAVLASTARGLVQKYVKACAGHKPRGLVLDVEGTYPFAAVQAAIDEARRMGITRLGIYMGSYRWRTRYKRLADQFDFIWLANYGKNTGYLSNIPDSPCDLHQYTSVATVPGIGDKTCDRSRLTGRKPLSYFTGRAHTGVEYRGIVKVTGNSVNVRSGASTNAGRIGVASKGQLYERRGNDLGIWTPINYKGMAGWIATQYVKAVSEK